MLMIFLLCTNILELEDNVRIYDETFARFGLVISTIKTETIASNTTEEIASRPSLISIRNDNLKNVRNFKYLGDIIANLKKQYLQYSSQMHNHIPTNLQPIIKTI